MKNWTEAQIKQLKGEGRIKKATKPVTSANALTQQVLRVLALKGYEAWRQPSHAVWDEKIKAYRKNSIKRGRSDVIGFKKSTGVVIACEIKVGRDKLSTEQEDFLQAVNEAGGVGVVIRNSDDIEKLIKEL
jgi:hypothetical protein